jgi:hypothetical protein
LAPGIRGSPSGSVSALIDRASVPLLYAAPQLEYGRLYQVNIARPSRCAARATLTL